MGVPALFRWLSRKYPKIISPVIEEDQHEIGGAKYEDPNPNGEIDNLYLDMNGIVHPCSHPENKKAPETEDEMFLDIFQYTDRVMMMARPRKVLMIAVDGVAPRAKMNQQRARRFRAAQDAKIKNEQLKIAVQERELRGEIIDDAIKGKKEWDSNAITPGTPFMDRLAEALRYWVAFKLANDPGWANLQVIISDATVPGEGEHKLMNFIRSQRSDPQYDPNTKHCIYGLDADLIFLGLATHEPHFRVLREDVFATPDKKFTIRDQIEEATSGVKKDVKKPFLWLHVNVLREYLQVELFIPRMTFPFVLERAIDDWVFLCFFAGNDFLPHLPSLDVRDNGIDTLVQCWKQSLPYLKNYVTTDGKLNLESVEVLMSRLATREDDIFQRRHAAEKRRMESNKRRQVAVQQDQALKEIYSANNSKGKDKAPITPDVIMPLLDTKGNLVEGYANLSNSDIVQNRAILTKANMANSDAAAQLKKLIDSKKTQVSAVQDQINSEQITSESSSSVVSSESEMDVDSSSTEKNSKKRPLEESESEAGSHDDIKLYEPGYQKRYYEIKFKCKTDEEIEQIRREVVRHYVEGIAWVALYYYQGCPSWKWYFPYHYAPFAADFTDLQELFPDGVQFDLGQPFRPFEQLMSVLPAASGHALPQVLRDLMSDPDSEIIDFYPEDFEIDMNGKKMSWQGIPLLPFIDEKRLLDSVQGKYDLLTADEKSRNTNKEAELFISPANKNYTKFSESLYEKNEETIDFKYAKSGLAGTIIKLETFNPNGIFKFPLKEGHMPNVDNKEYFEAIYRFPKKKFGKSMILNGHIPAHPALTIEDKNNLIYQLDKFDNRRHGGNNRFNSSLDNADYVNNGPAGKELFKVYNLRKGGYRSYMHYLSTGQRPDYSTQHRPQAQYGGQYNQQGGQYRQQNYNNNYQNNYNNNYQNNYNNNYNNSYNNNYKNNYQNNYNNNRYNNNNNTYNNSGKRSGYLPPK
ncbi:RAT1 5'-3' exoribonuclease 2 [Candida maltosa Xu316]